MARAPLHSVFSAILRPPLALPRAYLPNLINGIHFHATRNGTTVNGFSHRARTAATGHTELWIPIHHQTPACLFSQQEKWRHTERSGKNLFFHNSQHTVTRRAWRKRTHMSKTTTVYPKSCSQCVRPNSLSPSSLSLR